MALAQAHGLREARRELQRPKIGVEAWAVEEADRVPLTLGMHLMRGGDELIACHQLKRLAQIDDKRALLLADLQHFARWHLALEACPPK